MNKTKIRMHRNYDADTTMFGCVQLDKQITYTSYSVFPVGKIIFLVDTHFLSNPQLNGFFLLLIPTHDLYTILEILNVSLSLRNFFGLP